MVSRMLGKRSAVFAVSGFCWVKALAVFARWCVVSDSAGHTANGPDLIAGQSHEKSFTRLISNVRLEIPTFPSDWEPVTPFVRLGLGKDAPVLRHVPFELIDEVRA